MKEINIYKCNLVRESILDFDAIRNSEDAVSILKALGLCQAADEYMYMLCLNVKGSVVGVHEISHGDLCSSTASPREVYKRAILNNAGGIIIAHNHPSGDPTASIDDIQVTNRLAECGELLGIKLVDHIIIGGEGYLSMKAEGLLL